MPRKSQTFAIDFVNIPYYGEEESSDDTIKTKPRQGTSRFYAYVSIYLILRNKRYTLAVKYVRKGETLKDIINFLIKEIETVGFKIKGLYMDREFFTVEVINYLQKRKNTFHHTLRLERKKRRNTKLIKGRKKLFHKLHHAFPGR